MSVQAARRRRWLRLQTMKALDPEGDGILKHPKVERQTPDEEQEMSELEYYEKVDSIFRDRNNNGIPDVETADGSVADIKTPVAKRREKQKHREEKVPLWLRRTNEWIAKAQRWIDRYF